MTIEAISSFFVHPFILSITVESISSFLAHPFILLIAGASISSVLVTLLTQKWQNRKRTD